jgi:hypothetical protein
LLEEFLGPVKNRVPSKRNLLRQKTILRLQNSLCIELAPDGVELTLPRSGGFAV